MNHRIICFPRRKCPGVGRTALSLRVPAQSFSFPPMAYFMMVLLCSSPVTSSSLPSRQLLNDPLHSRMPPPPLGWWHPTFLPLPEARIALPRSRALALTSASYSPEAPGGDGRASGRAPSICTPTAIRLAVRHHRNSDSGFRSLKGTLS